MSGLIHGVGVSRAGEYVRSVRNEVGKSISSKEYVLWASMLGRCYSDKVHRISPTYIGCSISEGFKEFQYFAHWCQSQVGFGVGGYQLDKDLLTKSSKIYSEDACVFVPRSVNMFLNTCKAARGDFPIGVSSHRKKFYSRTVLDGKGTYLGTFPTVELAFQAYKIAKEAQAKSYAVEFYGLVDERVIDALNNYTVNIND